MKKKFKAILFDMDGTVVSTDHIWTQCNKDFLNKHNIFCEKKLSFLNNHMRGLPIQKCVESVQNNLLLHHITHNEIISDFVEIIKKNYDLSIEYIASFPKFGEKIKLNNIPRAIATNADDAGLLKTVKAVQLHKYFDHHLYGISCVNHRAKPHPDIYLYAAKKLGVAPEECIVFEDSPHGINAGNSAGMHTIAINSANIKNQLGKANRIIDSYDEIDIIEYFDIQHTS